MECCGLQDYLNWTLQEVTLCRGVPQLSLGSCGLSMQAGIHYPALKPLFHPLVTGSRDVPEQNQTLDIHIHINTQEF
jgi:hypothetical protein